MEQPLFLFARIAPKPAYFNQARDAILGIISNTRGEPGCRQFHLHEGQADGCLYLYEEFEDEHALADHYAQPYTKRVFKQYEAWLAEPVEITRLCRLD